MAVAAGAVALPTLLKLTGILAAQGQDITRVEQLPVELELGKARRLEPPIRRRPCQWGRGPFSPLFAPLGVSE